MSEDKNVYLVTDPTASWPAERPPEDATRAELQQQMTNTLARLQQGFAAYRYTVRLLEERACRAEARALELELANRCLRERLETERGARELACPS